MSDDGDALVDAQYPCPDCGEMDCSCDIAGQEECWALGTTVKKVKLWDWRHWLALGFLLGVSVMTAAIWFAVWQK